MAIVCREITPPGFSIDHIPRSNKKGGGVAIIYRDAFQSKREKVPSFKSFELIELTLRTSKDCIRFAVLYRPPSGGKTGQPVSIFLQEFQEYVDSHASSTGKLLIVGDFNLHMEIPSNPDASRFKDLIFSLNLQQHISTPTHEKGHTLDLVNGRLGMSNLPSVAFKSMQR